MNYPSDELSDELWALSNWKRPYDLGYLLRKLQAAGAKLEFTIQMYGHDQWVCMWLGHPPVKSDTPEDAACKLAIELFKQGVITRDAA